MISNLFKVSDNSKSYSPEEIKKFGKISKARSGKLEYAEFMEKAQINYFENQTTQV